MADAVPGLIAHWDFSLRCSFANRSYSQWFGRPLDEIVGSSMLSVLGEHRFALARPHIDAAMAGEEQRFERVSEGADGSVNHVWVNYVPDRGDDGAVRGFFVLVLDITSLRQAEKRALDSESQFRMLADHSTDMVFHLDRDFVRRYVSPACREILGCEPHEMIGNRAADRVHDEDVDRVNGVFRSLVDGSVERSSVTCRIRHKDGHWVWVEVEFRSVRDPSSGSPSGIIGAMRDVTPRKSMEAQLAEAHQQLERMARQDSLTGLANRRNFDEMFARYHAAAKDTGGKLSLVMIDVDRFKSFNDCYGHPAGDECLKRVSEAIMGSIRQPRDLAARYGGEEFAILLPGMDELGATQIAERVRRAVLRFALDHEASPDGLVTISAGVASMGSDAVGDGYDGLLEAADRALYAGKRQGRNVVIASSSLGARRDQPGLSEDPPFVGPRSSGQRRAATGRHR